MAKVHPRKAHKHRVGHKLVSCAKRGNSSGHKRTRAKRSKRTGRFLRG